MIVAVNKADNEKREFEGAEFHGLGWDETYAISAAHGRGTGDLLDAIVWALPPETEQEIARLGDRETQAEAWAQDVAAGRSSHSSSADPEGGRGGGTERPFLRTIDLRVEAALAGTPRSPRRPTWRPAAIAFVGRPNVGKSSLLTCSLGRLWTIVSRGSRHDA